MNKDLEQEIYHWEKLVDSLARGEFASSVEQIGSYVGYVEKILQSRAHGSCDPAFLNALERMVGRWRPQPLAASSEIHWARCMAELTREYQPLGGELPMLQILDAPVLEEARMSYVQTLPADLRLIALGALARYYPVIAKDVAAKARPGYQDYLRVLRKQVAVAECRFVAIQALFMHRSLSNQDAILDELSDDELTMLVEQFVVSVPPDTSWENQVQLEEAAPSRRLFGVFSRLGLHFNITEVFSETVPESDVADQELEVG